MKSCDLFDHLLEEKLKSSARTARVTRYPFKVIFPCFISFGKFASRMQARSSNVMSCSGSVADKEVQLPLSFLLLPDDPANQDIFVGNF